MKIIITVAAVVLAVLGIGRIGYHETHYTQDAQIKAVNGETITIETENGHLWDFIGEGWQTGEKIKVTFLDCGTSKIEDDQIEQITRR